MKTKIKKVKKKCFTLKRHYVDMNNYLYRIQIHTNYDIFVFFL